MGGWVACSEGRKCEKGDGKFQRDLLVNLCQVCVEDVKLIRKDPDLSILF